MSDLHLEFADIQLPGGDILILSGDIWTTKDLRSSVTFPEKRKRFARFATKEMTKYSRVLMVTGNHESYGERIDETDDIIRAFLATHVPHARLLANETEVIDGVAFLGTPLWATCGVGNPVLEMKIGGGMNDFHLIRTSRPAPEGVAARMVGQDRKFTPRDANRLHEEAIAWLRSELPKHKKCIVIGHHAPSFLSAGGDHHGNDLDSAYCSNLHDLIEAHPQIKVWIHGHTHRDERYQIGGAKVIANPRGYFPDERCSRFFDPTAADFELEEI